MIPFKAACDFSVGGIFPVLPTKLGYPMKHTRTFNMAIALAAAISGLIVAEFGTPVRATPVVIHFGQLVNNEADLYECLSCHDGLFAKDVGFRDASRSSHNNPLGNHAVDIAYPSGLSNRGDYATPSHVLQSGLRLPNGKVTCITCHDLRLVGREYFLPVPMAGSALCFVCHRV